MILTTYESNALQYDSNTLILCNLRAIVDFV